MGLKELIKECPLVFIKLKILTKKNRKIYMERYLECMNDRDFCYYHNIDYANPSEKQLVKAHERVYKNLIERGDFK